MKNTRFNKFPREILLEQLEYVRYEKCEIIDGDLVFYTHSPETDALIFEKERFRIAPEAVSKLQIAIYEDGEYENIGPSFTLVYKNGILKILVGIVKVVLPEHLETVMRWLRSITTSPYFGPGMHTATPLPLV